MDALNFNGSGLRPAHRLGPSILRFICRHLARAPTCIHRPEYPEHFFYRIWAVRFYYKGCPPVLLLAGSGGYLLHIFSLVCTYFVHIWPCSSACCRVTMGSTTRLGGNVSTRNPAVWSLLGFPHSFSRACTSLHCSTLSPPNRGGATYATPQPYHRTTAGGASKVQAKHFGS
jgi:hypothetical protein